MIDVFTVDVFKSKPQNKHCKGTEKNFKGISSKKGELEINTIGHSVIRGSHCLAASCDSNTNEFPVKAFRMKRSREEIKWEERTKREEKVYGAKTNRRKPEFRVNLSRRKRLISRTFFFLNRTGGTVEQASLFSLPVSTIQLNSRRYKNKGIISTNGSNFVVYEHTQQVQLSSKNDREGLF